MIIINDILVSPGVQSVWSGVRSVHVSRSRGQVSPVAVS